MFAGDVGLARLRQRHPSHPAVVRYDRIRAVLHDNGGLAYPGDDAVVADVLGMLIDRSTWAVVPSDNDFWDFLPDPRVRRHVETTIVVPDQFENTIAEVFVWGWLRQEGHEAELIGDEASPDLRVGRDTPTPLWADVKVVDFESAVRRARDDVTKANRQIKRVDPDGAGILFLRVSRSLARLTLDDRVPTDVGVFLDELRRALVRDRCRSVGAVVATWDEHLIVGNPPGRVLYVLRRRSIVVEHPDPRKPLALDPDAFAIGRTATAWVTWLEGDERHPSLPAVQIGDIIVSQLFRQENEGPEGIRAGHAVEALSDPDEQTAIELGEVEVVLAVRRVALGRRPYRLLVLATRHPDRAYEVMLAFRVYGEEGDEGVAPIALFQALLERHGIEVSVGPQRGLLVQRAVVPAGGSLVEFQGDRDFLVSAFIQRRGATVEVVWAFALDRASYRASLRGD